MTVKLTTDHSHLKIGELNVTVRPIEIEDKQIEAEFVKNLSAQSKHNRFMEGIRELSPSMLDRMCEIDYVNNMAYIATIEENGKEKQIGVCRYMKGNQNDAREMAITVADDYQNLGIGTELFNHLYVHARANCIKKLYSIDLRSNRKMHKFAHSVGMQMDVDPEDANQVIYSISPC
ncbi:GNAT family N-acetyltransferase [Aliiglaciecola sp. 3_MG-2023]|uniref:GNAT family N-acetyltransferase n=1 Tax=Aliiglaciecola sp. 3_MG-2023 TaxID=3062644 RepID=UPI0026E2DA91|nr:GNAT family N-acetyltransferase [Aliiglaciecola sp. 3_MG-2023]MDO6692562.1 GNAT family N-acetyltransferase [Aliiglaciecola sp. 3_MG-2023]